MTDDPGLDLYVTSQRQFRVDRLPDGAGEPLPSAAAARIERAFFDGQGAGLLHLATVEVRTPVPPALAFGRSFAQRYLTQLCHLGDVQAVADRELVDPPSEDDLSAVALDAPPMRGLEYLDAGALRAAWLALDARVRSDVVNSHGNSVRAYLHEKNPVWRLVGRVTFHLAENRRDEHHPFAFLATYAAGVSERGEARHLPLARALQEYSGADHRKRLVTLLTPIRDASERLPRVRELLESRDIYHPLAWSPAEAHRFLRDVPVLETSGLGVRIPDWWKPERPARPQVSARLGSAPAAGLGAESMLDFSVAVTLDGKPLTAAEREEILSAALAHWKRIERDAGAGGLSFYEGMRLLAGAANGGHAVAELAEPLRQWSGIEAGNWLRELLARLRNPDGERELSAEGLRASLRPYQVVGAKWLALLTGLGLGACLADDMGLGKTLQVIALLVHLREQATEGQSPSLIVA